LKGLNHPTQPNTVWWVKWVDPLGSTPFDIPISKFRKFIHAYTLRKTPEGIIRDHEILEECTR